MEKYLDLIATGQISDFKDYLKTFYKISLNYDFDEIKCLKCNNVYMIKRSYIDKKTKTTKKFLGCSNYLKCKNVE